VVTVTATAVAPGDVKRNLCDQNGGQLMMTDRHTDTVMWIHTDFLQLIRNQMLTVEDLLVRFVFRYLENIRGALGVIKYSVVVCV